MGNAEDPDFSYPPPTGASRKEALALLGVPPSPMPLAAEGVTEARKRAAEAEDYARLRLDGILAEARAICAVVGLVPLSKLEGIVEPRKHRKGKKSTSRPAPNRGLPKGEVQP